MIILLCQGKDHQRPVSRGIEARISNANLNIRSGEDAVPITGINFAGIFTIRAISNCQLVAGKAHIPTGIRFPGVRVIDRVHQHGHQGGVRGGYNIDGHVQVCHVADDLDAAVKLTLNIHIRMELFKIFFELCKGCDQTACRENHQRCLSGWGGFGCKCRFTGAATH